MKFTRRALGATALAALVALPAYAQDKGTIGIAMDSQEQVDAWHKAGVAAGGAPRAASTAAA